MLKKILRFLLAFVSIYGLVALGLYLSSQPAPDHPWIAQFSPSDYPLVIAHADDAGTSPWPGDTLLFLENAAALGVDVLEMNVHLSADGVIVLIHDDTVDDTTEGTGPVSEKTLAELKLLDAAYDWTADNGTTYPFRAEGLTIPALEEVFQVFPDWPMVVEIKGDSPALPMALCELIREYGMQNKVIVPSFSDAATASFRTACPEVATAGSSGEVRQFVILNLLFLANPLQPAYSAHQVPIESGGIPVINNRFVGAAHDRNLQVHAWTINDPAEMQTMIDLGVDAIMTDRLDVLLDLLER